MKNIMLSGKGICKTFINGSNTTNVLRNLDVEIKKGDFTVIMGASGSGKSTLLYCISGIDQVTTGQIMLGDKRVDTLKEKDMADIRRKDIGFIFQESNLIDDFDVFENIAMSGYLISKDRTVVNERVEELLEDMDMLEHRKKYPSELSGGQKQRTAIARSLINNPSLIFADEPTGALNAKQSELVLDMLSQINKDGQSILMVTHDIKAAARANRLLYIHDGKIDGILDMEKFQVGSLKERELQVFEFISSRGGSMFVVLKSALTSIKKQKMQTILVGIVLVLVSAIFFTGLSLITQPKAYKAMYKRANAAHSHIIMPRYQPIVSEIIDLLNENEQVETIAEYQTTLCGLDTEIDGETKNTSILLTEFNQRDDVDILYIDENKIVEPPASGEILINYVFARQMGLDIGDTVKITAGETMLFLKVAGIVVDAQYSNSFISPDRVFVSLNFFDEENIDYELVSIFVKYKDPENVNETDFFNDLYRELDADAIPITWHHKDFLMAHSMVQSIISGVFIAVSLLILFIVIFVIRTIISDTIYKKFKQIGIQKAVGYSEKQIMMSIIFKYVFIGALSSTIGSGIGIIAQRRISQVLNADIKVHTTAPIGILIPITILLIVGLLILFSYTKIKKLREIKPVQAIKYGIPEMNFKPDVFDISKRKSSILFLIAIKDFLKNRKKTIGNILLITLLVFPTLVFFNMSYTISNQNHFANNLMGLKVGDYAVTNAEEDSARDAYTKIKDIDGVDKLLVMSYEDAFNTLSFTRSDGSKQTAMEKVFYGDTDFDLVLLKQGRQIEADNEIIITSLVAEDSSKSIGDYITIYNNEASETYLICGIYDSMESNGYSYVRYENTIPEDFVQSQVSYWIYTEDADLTLSKLDAFVKVVLGESAITSRFDIYVQKIIDSIAFLPLVISAMLLVFIIINLLIVLNFTIIDINSSHKKFGIMKAIGFTKVNIVVILIIKTIITALIGGALALMLSFIFADMLMQMSISMSYSIISLPLIHNVIGSIGVVFVFALISVLSTLIPTKRISAVSPRQLISE